MDDVRTSSAWVAKHSSHFIVDSTGIEKAVNAIDSIPKVVWNYEGIHYFDNGPLTVQYLFVLDALNFCFWPDKELNYDILASGLKEPLLIRDKTAFDADRLQIYTGPQLRELLKWPRPLPLEDERVRLLHEVGFELERSFEGKATKIVECSGKSAMKLVALVSWNTSFSWGQGYGEFEDIDSVTIMADYIVPAVLTQLGVLKYSPSLVNTIENNGEIGSGSEEEVELRACSVSAVEEMRELINDKPGKQVISIPLPSNVYALRAFPVKVKCCLTKPEIYFPKEAYPILVCQNDIGYSTIAFSRMI